MNGPPYDAERGGSMIGYARKVGLRKSRLHFAALRARRVVRQVPDREPLPWTDCVCGGCDPRGQESDDGQVHGPDGWRGGT